MSVWQDFFCFRRDFPKRMENFLSGKKFLFPARFSVSGESVENFLGLARLFFCFWRDFMEFKKGAARYFLNGKNFQNLISFSEVVCIFYDFGEIAWRDAFFRNFSELG